MGPPLECGQGRLLGCEQTCSRRIQALGQSCALMRRLACVPQLAAAAAGSVQGMSAGKGANGVGRGSPSISAAYSSSSISTNGCFLPGLMVIVTLALRITFL